MYKYYENVLNKFLHLYISVLPNFNNFNNINIISGEDKKRKSWHYLMCKLKVKRKYLQVYVISLLQFSLVTDLHLKGILQPTINRNQLQMSSHACMHTYTCKRMRTHTKYYNYIILQFKMKYLSLERSSIQHCPYGSCCSRCNSCNKPFFNGFQLLFQPVKKKKVLALCFQ